jgi:hypothetical protein
MSPNKNILQVVLNRRDKEQLVIKMHHEGRTMREIAQTAHMSFGDIKKIIDRVDGIANDDIGTDLKNKSKATRALCMFNNGKKPIEVAIELDISYSEVIDLQQEYWALKELYDLPLIYQELKYNIDSFYKLFQILKKNKMLSEKHISKFLRYADHDIPSLENRIRKLTNDVIELEFKKKDLNNTIILQRAQLSDLGQAIIRYQNAIDNKKV